MARRSDASRGGPPSRGIGFSPVNSKKNQNQTAASLQLHKSPFYYPLPPREEHTRSRLLIRDAALVSEWNPFIYLSIFSRLPPVRGNEIVWRRRGQMAARCSALRVRELHPLQTASIHPREKEAAVQKKEK